MSAYESFLASMAEDAIDDSGFDQFMDKFGDDYGLYDMDEDYVRDFFDWQTDEDGDIIHTPEEMAEDYAEWLADR